MNEEDIFRSIHRYEEEIKKLRGKITQLGRKGKKVKQGKNKHKIGGKVCICDAKIIREGNEWKVKRLLV